MGSVSSHPARRAAQIERVLAETGQISALSVLLSQAVADHVGLNPTDVEALDILRRDGPLSAGRLAEVTGLSTGGAITKLIDRLERVGYVRREPDPADRRRVLVRALVERAEHELGPLYAGLEEAMRALLAGYSDEEIEVILDFSARTNRIIAAQIAQVRRLTATRASTSVEESI
jgi:DNA-binding MarR family transcriptional regulator